MNEEFQGQIDAANATPLEEPAKPEPTTPHDLIVALEARLVAIERHLVGQTGYAPPIVEGE